MHVSNRKFVVVVTLALVLALVACASPTPTRAPAPTVAPSLTATLKPTVAPSPTATPKPISLRMATSGDESTLTPYTYVTGYPGWNMLTLIYDTLFVMDADNLPKPWIAREDKVSADGKTHTLTLRNDVKWHDGKPLTSADVKFSYEFYKKNTHARWTSAVPDFTSIETPNETTVIITLKEPSAAFAIQTLADVPIIPKHIWESVTDPKKFVNNIGSGPFKLAEYKADQFYRFVANDAYFAGKPAVDELVMPIIKEVSTTFAALKSGEIHATTRALTPETIKEMQADANLKVQRGPVYATTLMLFNNDRAPWDKKEVRQAVALAIDQQKLVDTVLLGFGTVGNLGWIHPASPYHDPTIKNEYNLTKAKALLDGLGYKDTDNDGIREAAGKKMEATLLVYSTAPTRVRSAELIAAALKEIGISVKVSAQERGAVDAKVWPGGDPSQPRDYDLAMWGWSAPVQVNLFRMVTLVHSDPKIGTLNNVGYKSAQADKIGSELLATMDSEKQKTLARQLEAIVAQDVPFVVLYYEDGVYAYRPAVYDQWVFQKGQGIFHKLTFLPNVK
jgi:peptide/nickel transport system substrate-binding protein